MTPTRYPHLYIAAGRPVTHRSPDLRHRRAQRTARALSLAEWARLAVQITLALGLAWLLVAALFSFAPAPQAAKHTTYRSAH